MNTTGCVQISNIATSSHQTSNVIKCSCVSIPSCDDASYNIVSLCAAPEGQCITTRDAITSITTIKSPYIIVEKDYGLSWTLTCSTYACSHIQLGGCLHSTTNSYNCTCQSSIHYIVSY